MKKSERVPFLCFFCFPKYIHAHFSKRVTESKDEALPTTLSASLSFFKDDWGKCFRTAHNPQRNPYNPTHNQLAQAITQAITQTITQPKSNPYPNKFPNTWLLKNKRGMLTSTPPCIMRLFPFVGSALYKKASNNICLLIKEMIVWDAHASTNMLKELLERWEICFL